MILNAIKKVLGSRNDRLIKKHRKTVAQIKLPEGTTIGAIVRGEEVIMAHHDIVIENEDHLVMFLLDKNKFNAVEKLFQVGVTFF